MSPRDRGALPPSPAANTNNNPTLVVHGSKYESGLDLVEIAKRVRGEDRDDRPGDTRQSSKPRRTRGGMQSNPCVVVVGRAPRVSAAGAVAICCIAAFPSFRGS